MATTMEQRAKFRELRLAGTSREDAMKQAYGSVAPVPPTANPPITPPTPTADPPQTMQGVNGEIFQIAPVNPQTGLSAPTQPVAQPTQPVQPATPTPAPVTPSTTSVTPTTTTPTSEVKPTPVKTEAPIDYNTSVGREAEIQKNVAEITKGNPALLKDRNAFNKAFGYDTADQGKKALLDSAFMGGNQPMDQKSVLNAFISGVSVPEQNTQAYRNAKVQFDTFKKFNAMTPTQLLDNLKQGQIGTEMDALLNQNPNYAQAKAELAKFQKNASLNRMVKSALNVVNGREPDDLSNLSKIEAKYNAPPGTNQEAYQAYVVQNEDVKKAGLALTGIARQISDTAKLYNDALTQIKKDYPDLSASAILVLMQTKTKDTRELLDSLADAKTLAQGDFDLAMKMAEGNYEAYTKDLANANEIAKEQRAMENSLALSQMQFDQKIAQQAQAMNDPTMAISTMIDEYKKLGIPFSRSTQQIIADFKTSGLNLPTYLSNLQSTIQTKPEYKAIQDAKKGEGISYQTFGDKVYKKNADGSLTETYIKLDKKDTQDWAKLDDTTLYNQRTGELKKVSASEASSYGPSTVEVTPDAIKGLSSRLSGNNVQCGMVSNDYMAVKFPQAPKMGDSYESKVKSVEAIGVSDVPQVGGVFAMNTYNSNGHTGIVQSVDLAKGTFTATDANRAGSQNGGPVTTSTYKISDNFTFSKAPAGAGAIRPSDIDFFNSATATEKKKLSTDPQYIDFNNKKSIVMSDPNADIYEVMKFSQGGKDMGEERLKSLGKFSQGLSQVAELSKKIQEIQTGPIIGRIRSYNPYDANAQALLAEINATVPNIARGVYGEVGVLTDADIENYAKTLPNIKSTEDTNKLVLAMTLKTMLNGFKGQIQIDGSAGRDVSGFVGTVKQYEDKINQLLSTLGGGNASMPSVNNTLQSDWDNLDNLP